MKLRWVGIACVAAMFACGDDGGVRVNMDFARDDFYDAPFR